MRLFGPVFSFAFIWGIDRGFDGEVDLCRLFDGFLRFLLKSFDRLHDLLAGLLDADLLLEGAPELVAGAFELGNASSQRFSEAGGAF